MREQFYIQGIQQAHARVERLEDKLRGIYKVLEEIIGKELLRGQALHKVLMDKGLFTDEELKKALEVLIEESKAEMKKMEEKAKEEKAKAVELLVPAGANLKPPIEGATSGTASEPPQTQGTEPTPPTEASNG
jgi:hypothetical protein